MSQQDRMVETIHDKDRFVVFVMDEGMKRPTAKLTAWASFRVMIANALGVGDLQKTLELQRQVIDSASGELRTAASMREAFEQRLAAETKLRVDAETAMAFALNELSTRVSRGADATGSIATRVTTLEELPARIKALADGSLRMEVVTGTVVTAGVAVARSFAKEFKAAPQIIPIPGWADTQMIDPVATKITTTGTEIVVKRSRGTLALSAGPFENAPAGTPFAAVAIGI